MHSWSIQDYTTLSYVQKEGDSEKLIEEMHGGALITGRHAETIVSPFQQMCGCGDEPAFIQPSLSSQSPHTSSHLRDQHTGPLHTGSPTSAPRPLRAHSTIVCLTTRCMFRFPCSNKG